MADGARRVLVTLDASALAAVERFPSMNATLRLLIEIALAKREIRS